MNACLLAVEREHRAQTPHVENQFIRVIPPNLEGCRAWPKLNEQIERANAKVNDMVEARFLHESIPIFGGAVSQRYTA